MTTLRLHASFWRNARSTILVASIALSTILAPAGVAAAVQTDAPGEGFTVSDTSDLSGISAQVSTDGDALNMRAEPSVDSEVVTTLADGTIVELRIDVVDTVYDDDGTRWWPVSSEGVEGWVSGFYLVDPGTSGTASDGTGASSTVADTGFTWDGGSLERATAIAAANDDGLRMRDEPDHNGDVIASIPNGTVIELRIDMVDTVYDEDGVTRWWPVMYDGEAGWVAGTFLMDAGGLEPGSEPFDWAGSELTGATASVRSSGEGLHLRAEPSLASEILESIPDGTVVDLRIDMVDTVYDDDGVTRWWPVTYNGQEGWVSGFFLSDGTDTASSGDSDAGTTGSGEQFEWTGDSLIGATAIASGDGDDVDVYTEPSAGSGILTTVADGSTVDLRIDVVDTVIGADGTTRWWPVVVDGENGWISGFSLTDGASTDSGTSDIFPAGSTAMVQTQTGSGARLRSAAGMDNPQVGSVVERGQVTVIGGPVSHENSQNGWFEVDHNGTTGYIDGDLLVLLSTPEAQDPPETDTEAERSTERTAATTPPTESSDEETPTSTPETDTEGEDRPTPTPTETTVPETEPAERDDEETPTPTETVEVEVEEEEEPDPTPTPTDEPPEESEESAQAFIMPVPGARQTQGFGCSSLGFYPYNPDWGCGVHDGIDFAAPAYTPILASAAGTVVTAGWCDCGLGYYVEIDHGNGVHTLYGHMASQPYVSVGQQVAQGETIGPVGSTGLSTGPHTHFMVQVNGVSQDPARYLP